MTALTSPIPLVVFALIVGVAVGASIEAARHRCPQTPAQILARLDQAEARARDWYRWSIRWQRAAHRWKRTADGHAVVLAALGRVVAEGGTVSAPADPRHPSQGGGQQP